MNEAEAARVLELAVAAWPNQEYSPETVTLWAHMLAPFHVEDALEKLQELAGDQKWFHISDLTRSLRYMITPRCPKCGIWASNHGGKIHCGRCGPALPWREPMAPLPRGEDEPTAIGELLSDEFPEDPA